MNKNLLENLKRLCQIQPDSDYTARSRFLILAEPTRLDSARLAATTTQIYRPVFAIGLISVLILMSAIGVYYISKPNQNDLVIKAHELNSSIQIELNEIKYLIENSQYLNVENIHDIQILLGKTTNELKEASALSQESKDLEKSLEKIRSAQETLLQISALLK